MTKFYLGIDQGLVGILIVKISSREIVGRWSGYLSVKVSEQDVLIKVIHGKKRTLIELI